MTELQEHLFRSESGRIIAALTRIFGVHNLALAEDVVQDAFCRAAEMWRVRGVPDNPAAWLMTAARNRALDLLRRQRTAQRFAPELGRLLDSEWTRAAAVAEAFDDHIVRDEQLRMMFSCCHPQLPERAQIALILNILCGFSAGEVAAAFIESRAAVEKRIARGKQTLAEAQRLFELTDTELTERLSTVRRTLYLLFNEGYHGASPESPVRRELCHEALRLATLLGEHPAGAGPETDALTALMCLHAARLPARCGPGGALRPLFDQDRTAWDRRLLAKGIEYLERATTGDRLAPYHLEAAIAVTHAAAPDAAATDWTRIVELYDRLTNVAPSPVVSLNRAMAIAQRDGPDRGIDELHRIPDQQRLLRYPFFPAALGELERRRGNTTIARSHLLTALALARNQGEREFLERRIRELAGYSAEG